MHNAQVLASSQRLTAQLGQALSRAVIDQALGIVMSRTGAGPEEAFDRLRAMSQFQHVKVAQVARVLVDEALRSARARRPAPGSRRPSCGVSLFDRASVRRGLRSCAAKGSANGDGDDLDLARLLQ